MTKDRWLDRTANWDTPSDWSLGLPSSSSNVLIDRRGSPEVTASFGTVNSITNSRRLTFTDAGVSSVSHFVTNSYALYLDPFDGHGGSTLTIGGTLTNSGSLQIGNVTLSAASTVRTAKIVNSNVSGFISIIGSRTALASLDVSSAAGFGAVGLLTGQVHVSGDALVEFGSGQITSIAAASRLTLIGSHAFVADARDTSSNSALAGLESVAGALYLQGGATVATSRVLTNTGTISATASSKLTAASLVNDATINLNENASLTMSRALSNSGTGAISVGQNGALEAASLANAGEVELYEDGSATTSGGLINSGTISLDAVGGNGSSLTVGGRLTNSGSLDIGAAQFSGPATVEAGSLANVDGAAYGTILLIGSATGQATLDVGSAAGFGAAGVLYGQVTVDSYYGAALAEFKSGQITIIAADSTLDLIGAYARVADASDPSSNSALSLRTVAGTLQLDLGATLATPGGLTNSGSITLGGSSEDGGCFLRINGTLMNSGTIQIGSVLSPTEGSTLEAAKIVNDGAIDLDGGKASQGSLHTGGAFTNDGSVDLVHDTETIGGAVSGSGDFSLKNSTLEFVHGVSSGETVTFSGGVNHTDHLYLDSPSSFGGTVDGFATPGDSVIAKGFAEAATTLNYTQRGADSCSWTLTDSTHTAVFNFAGAPYAQSDFSISASANGNTLIKFV
jgi:hypothetical protein